MEPKCKLLFLIEFKSIFNKKGHDTVAAAMSWFLHCISTHPDEQRKLFDEVDAIFGDSDRSCTLQDASQLKYLECCIKETLRLYPSVPGIMRNLTEDIQIGRSLTRVVYKINKIKF